MRFLFGDADFFPLGAEGLGVLEGAFAVHVVFRQQQVRQALRGELLVTYGLEQLRGGLIKAHQLGEVDIGRSFAGDDALSADSPEDESFFDFHIDRFSLIHFRFHGKCL